MAKKYNYFDDEYESTMDRSRKKIQSKVDSLLEDDGEKSASSVNLDLFTVERRNRPQTTEPKKKKAAREIKLPAINIKKPNRSSREDKKKDNTPSTTENAKEILSNALVLAKIGSKKAERFVKSAAKQAKSSRLATKHRVIIAIMIIVVLVVAMVVTVFSTMNLVSKETKRETEFNEAAAKVCTSYEEDFGACNYEDLEEYGVEGYRMTGLCYVREMDFNDDKTSELLVCYNRSGEYYAEVWGFDGDEFVQMYKGLFVQTDDVKDDVWFTIYTDKGKSYICEHSRDDVKKVTVLAFRGKKFSKKTVCTYDPASEAYTIKGDVDLDSFERIRMSVLRNRGAVDLADSVQDIVYNFTGRGKGEGILTDRQQMLNEYYGVVEKYIDTYGKTEYVSKNSIAYMNGVSYVDLIDFNNDDKEELIIVYRKPVNYRQDTYDGSYVSYTENKYFCEVYSWNGANAWRVFQREGLSEIMDDNINQCLMIYTGSDKKQLCFNTFKFENYSRTMYASSKFVKFDGEKFVDGFRAWYSNDYGYHEYRINGEYVSEATFRDKKGYQAPFFDGTETYDSKKYTIIFVQSDKAHSSRVGGMADKTAENIRKLNKNYEQ